METSSTKSKSFRSIQPSAEPTIKTGNELFDNWLSKDGGFVTPSCILLSGDSGSGKTTIMVNLMKSLKDVKTSMYSREMRETSVKDQTKNVKFEHDNAFISDEISCPGFDAYMEDLEILKPRIVIIDSLQAITEQDFPEMSEEESEKYVVSKLRNWANDNNGCVILICHNTKDGDYKGSAGIRQFLDAHAVTRFNKKDGSRKIGFETKNRKGKLGELFYSFEKDGVDFFSSEDWIAKNQKERNFGEVIANAINSYLITINKEHQNYPAFKKEYNSSMKKISKIEDSGVYMAETIILINKLSSKFEI